MSFRGMRQSSVGRTKRHLRTASQNTPQKDNGIGRQGMFNPLEKVVKEMEEEAIAEFTLDQKETDEGTLVTLQKQLASRGAYTSASSNIGSMSTAVPRTRERQSGMNTCSSGRSIRTIFSPLSSVCTPMNNPRRIGTPGSKKSGDSPTSAKNRGITESKTGKRGRPPKVLTHTYSNSMQGEGKMDLKALLASAGLKVKNLNKLGEMANVSRAQMLKNKDETIKSLREIIILSIDSKELRIAARAFELLGDVFMFYKDYIEAIRSLTKMKMITEINLDQEGKFDRECKLRAYKKMGICFHNMNQYHMAIKSFKKVLVLAWEGKDQNAQNAELESYDRIGLSYYYLNDLEKANYYHERSICGKLQSESSRLRKQKKIINLKAARLNYYKHDTHFVNMIIQGIKTYVEKREIARVEKAAYLPRSNSQNFMVGASLVNRPKSQMVQNFVHNDDINESLLDELSLSELPSPRAQTEEKEILLLPHFSEYDNKMNKLTKKAQLMMNIRKYPPVMEFISKREREASYQGNKERRISKEKKIERRLNPVFIAKMIPVTDNYTLLKKSNTKKNMRYQFAMTLTHLSPGRIQPKKLNELRTKTIKGISDGYQGLINLCMNNSAPSSPKEQTPRSSNLLFA